MFRSIISQIQSLLDYAADRRQLVLGLSGGLIVVSLLAGPLAGLPGLRRPLMVAAAVIAGTGIAVRAFRALRTRKMSIDLLVTIATVGALAIGEVWEAAALTFLFTFGAVLEGRTMNKTRGAIKDLLDLAPQVALVLRDGEEVEVPAYTVQPGETVIIRPGGKIPVDGIVTSGHSAVTESAITGEPMPVEKNAGNEVYAGTINHAGLLEVRAEGAGADTTLARIIRRVEEAQEERVPTQRIIERFAQWYTPAIIVLGVLTFAFTRDLHLALTLLVIACPGALVVAAPVSVVAGIGQAARNGVLIKGGAHLERAAQVTALALDKTGTLTLGRPVVMEVIPLDGESKEEVLELAAYAEAGSEHPLARAIVDAAEVKALPISDAFATETGAGVIAEVDGRTIQVGRSEWIEQSGVLLEDDERRILEDLESEGRTVATVAVDGRTVGFIGLDDSVRPEAQEALAALRKQGITRLLLLSGDQPGSVERIAEKLDLSDARGRQMPDDKYDVVKQLQEDGYVVAMIGDGINDAPALAAADVGIAMGVAGTDVAIETATIALMGDDLRRVPEAFHLAKKTLRNIRQNVVIALATAAALVVAVFLGHVHMAGGMLIHQASVLAVLLNGMRLMRS